MLRMISLGTDMFKKSAPDMIRVLLSIINPEHFVGMVALDTCVLSKDGRIPVYFAVSGTYNGMDYPSSCNNAKEGWDPRIMDSKIKVDFPLDPYNTLEELEDEDASFSFDDDVEESEKNVKRFKKFGKDGKTVLDDDYTTKIDTGLLNDLEKEKEKK